MIVITRSKMEPSAGGIHPLALASHGQGTNSAVHTMPTATSVLLCAGTSRIPMEHLQSLMLSKVPVRTVALAISSPPGYQDRSLCRQFVRVRQRVYDARERPIGRALGNQRWLVFALVQSARSDSGLRDFVGRDPARRCNIRGSMKKVLIIAYSFPPITNMGSHRILRFVRHLREFDWEPIVLTGKLTNRAALR